MPGEEAANDTLMVAGAGATTADALRSLVAASVRALLDGNGRPGDHTAVVRAAAGTLERLIPDFVTALLATGEDLGLDLTDASLDGLIAMDDGWRAWGTVSGEPAAGLSTSAWRAGTATIERGPGGVRLTLMLERV